MIYIVALLLILALIFEAMFLRKGLKSAKKKSTSLRNDHATPLSSRPNKRMKTSSEVPLPETPQDEDRVSLTPGNYHQGVVEFPERGDLKQEPSISEGLRSAVKSVEPETSVHDMIQEIRGSKLLSGIGTEMSPTVEAKETKPDEEENLDEYEEVLEYEELPAEDEIGVSEPGRSAMDENPTITATLEEDEPSEIPEDVLASGTVDDELGGLEELEEAEIVPSPEELLKAGIRCVRQGKLDEGIAILEQAVASSPEKAEAHFNLGIAYTLQEFHPSAIRSYLKAIKLDPQYGKAFFNLGTLYLKQGNVKEAIDKLEQAVRFLSDPMKALWNLYEAYRSSELFPKALSTLERLIGLEPEDASLYNHLGICYAKLGKYPEAIEAWKRSVSLGASSRLIFYNLGKTYELCGKTDEAVEQYEQFLQLNSNSSDWTELMEEVQERLEILQLQSDVE